ncbi:MAG: DUF2442 domain-containing protein [Candidatus Margulisbacteria bacterium]|nr:DUF2442 domain-containing protein [Candidatus Margulisiibacteriota bacterium]
MLYDVLKIKHLEDYKLELEFENGVKGVIDFSVYLKKGGVFGKFKNMNYFRKAYINMELGTICWPGSLDIAPETLYAKLKSKK